MSSKNKRFAEFARVIALPPRALYAEFDPDAERLRRRARAERSGTTHGDDHGSDYDSDDNTTSTQMHRFFAKVASAGIDLGDNVLADPSGLNQAQATAAPSKQMRVCHVLISALTQWGATLVIQLRERERKRYSSL